MQYTFILEGLNCPNCAARIEADIKKLPQVRDVTLNLMQQKLTLEASEDPHTTLETIVHRYEPHVQVLPQDRELPPSQNHKIKPMLLRMGIGALVFLAGLLLGLHGTVSRSLQLAVYVAAYGILGYDVVLRAIKNILRGRVFDENFLMSLSSMGAFFIGEYPEAVAVMLFYQVGEFFQGLAVQRSRRSIAELMDIRPDTARVKRSGGTVTVDPRDVCVGEWILVKPGEKIPLDGVVLTGDSLVDTRALTGESVPRSVHPMDTVLSGCINETGLLTIQVTKPYGQSTVARILQMAETAAARKAPTEQFITTFARYYTPGVVVLAALLAVIPPLCFAAPWTEWIRRAFVFLVVSCPCALVLSVPLTFFGGIGAASRHGVLVKGGNFLEALNKVDTVVFDKTGTLTQGTFRVDSVLPAQGVDREQVLQAAARAEHFSNHPIARSVLAEVGPLPPMQLTDFAQLPGQGVRIRAAGKLILAGNPRLMQAHSIPYTPCDLVGTQVYVAENGRYLGCILIRDQLKPDSKSAIAALKAMGVRKTVMLTGDDKVIADHVARELGLDESYAQLLPDGKVQRLEALDAAKAPGRKLAFLGDGINDAPVLARSDIGIAMGGLGSDAAIEAADVVLMTDEPSKLLEAMTVAAATHRIVVQNIVFSLAVKGAFLVLGALGMVGMWLAVFADVGVALIAVGNAMRILKH